MFADSLLDSAWAHDSRRGWTTALVFAVESVAVAGLLMLPVIYGEGLPQQLQSIARIVAPAPPPGIPATPHAQTAQASNMSSAETLIEPQTIPSHTLIVTDEVVPPMPDGGVYVMNGTGDRWTNNPVMHSILTTVPTVVPPPMHATVHLPPVSRIMEGNLIYKVQPDYPPLARQARIQGAVVLQAVISREGTIEKLQVMSGHPMLGPSALAAVKQWRYRPYFLNGEPVEVETQVTVNFILGGE
jgi:protein TonB